MRCSLQHCPVLPCMVVSSVEMVDVTTSCRASGSQVSLGDVGAGVGQLGGWLRDHQVHVVPIGRGITVWSLLAQGSPDGSIGQGKKSA